jgi:hypothetical protein
MTTTAATTHPARGVLAPGRRFRRLQTGTSGCDLLISNSRVEREPLTGPTVISGRQTFAEVQRNGRPAVLAAQLLLTPPDGGRIGLPRRSGNSGSAVSRGAAPRRREGRSPAGYSGFRELGTNVCYSLITTPALGELLTVPPSP